jgi:hypothetical protein
MFFERYSTKAVPPNNTLIIFNSLFSFIHICILKDTPICISLIHHRTLTAVECEAGHLTPYMSNIQAIVNIIQFKNNNYVHIKIKFKIAKIINRFMIKMCFF